MKTIHLALLGGMPLCSDIVVTGNIFRDQVTNFKRTVRFQTRKEAVACSYEAFTFTGNVFDGEVAFVDRTSPAKTTIKDIVLADGARSDVVQ